MAIELTQSFEDVKIRLAQTRAVQNTIAAAWTWENASLATWDEWLRQFDPQSVTPTASLANIVKGFTVALANAKQALDGKCSSLQLTIAAALSGLRGRGREEEDLADAIAGLSSFAESRAGIERNGLALLEAWEDYNVNWTPGSPHNYSFLQQMLGELPALDKTWRKAGSDLRKAEKNLRKFAQMVEDKCMGWYVAATGFFPAGTPEGDLIRGDVPVSTAPNTTPAPAKPGILPAQALGNGRIFADCQDAAGATKYRWYTKGPGDAAFVFRAETGGSEALLMNLTPGAHDVRATGTNSSGEGLPSDLTIVTVT